MNTKFVATVILFGLAVGAMAETASAGDGIYYGRYYAGYARHYDQPSRPYFADNPPVYYSLPVSRPYGLSPYAWPPMYRGRAIQNGARCHSCQAARPLPLVVQNPYVSQAPAISASPVRKAGGPLRIRNPYFAQDSEPSIGPVASVGQ